MAPLPHPDQHPQRLANGRFAPGNHGGGRRKGSVNKRCQTAQALFDAEAFDPLQRKIRFAKTLEARLTANRFEDTHERIEYLKLYNDALKDLLQYSYQKLKAIEHAGALTILQKLEALEACSDEELAALLIEAEELMHGSQHTDKQRRW